MNAAVKADDGITRDGRTLGIATLGSIAPVAALAVAAVRVTNAASTLRVADIGLLLSLATGSPGSRPQSSNKESSAAIVYAAGCVIDWNAALSNVRYRNMRYRDRSRPNRGGQSRLRRIFHERTAAFRVPRLHIREF
jgi:hypothetical protein